jgi:hypothetical protein
MFLNELPGIYIEDDNPKLNIQDILGEAGRQLAQIHIISVDGFG